MSAASFPAAFYNSERYSDVLIKIGHKTFFAHRMVLSQSDYFEALFNSKMKETTTLVEGKLVLEIQDVTIECLEIHLQHLYGVPLYFSSLSFYKSLDLYRETERFLNTSFNKKILEVIEEHRVIGLSADNTIAYLEFVSAYNLPISNIKMNDIRCLVIASLSYSAVLHLITNMPNTTHIPVLVWIATHPDEPLESLKALIRAGNPNRLHEKEIDNVLSFRVVPVLNDYILDLLTYTVRKLEPNSTTIGYNYDTLIQTIEKTENSDPHREDRPLDDHSPTSGCGPFRDDIYRSQPHGFLYRASYDNGTGRVEVIGRFVDGQETSYLTEREKAFVLNHGWSIAC